MLTKSQRGRIAIRSFKTAADALALRGYFKPSGRSGETLETALRNISPEIYGSMNDPRIIELKGLEYVLERLPKGIEFCTKIILTARDDFKEDEFELIVPPKRRRDSYRISDTEMCFVVTRGVSEIYDILTHLTFLNIEARKIYQQMLNDHGEVASGWRQLERTCRQPSPLSGKELDQAIWDLSILLGTTYRDTRATYEYLEAQKATRDSNHGLFQIVCALGRRVAREKASRDDEMLIYFTPVLRDLIGSHTHSRKWAQSVKDYISQKGYMKRPLHIISANMHSVRNLLYGYAAVPEVADQTEDDDLYGFCVNMRSHGDTITEFAARHGCHFLKDESGAFIDCQVIDTCGLGEIACHPQLKLDLHTIERDRPVLLVLDYAFGTQAFEIMDELLAPVSETDEPVRLNVHSIAIMGKAGILPGAKGDIMLPTAHVLEGTSHNYIVKNDLSELDFDASVKVYCGPIVTVLGTSLQNRDVLKKFQQSSWKAVGLEMEGGHFQRAISAAIVRGHIARRVKTLYAYYASDNPLQSGQTLSSGSMGDEGVRPTYMITKVVLEKMLNPQEKRDDQPAGVCTL
jgi:hypothetical protein